MANCEDLITTDDLAAAKIYANKMTEFVESSNNTMTTPEGEDKLTITGMGDIAKETISIAVSSAGYTIVGDFSDSSKVTITSDNQVYTSKLVSGSEDALWRTNQVLPYTPTGADPTSGAESGKWVVVAQGELKSIARSLNVLNTQVIYSTDTTTALDDVLYIYDASEQVTYAKPSDVGAGEVVVSVDNGVLTTDAGNYDLEVGSGSVQPTGRPSLVAMADQFALVYNPIHWGCIGNGVSDDSVNMQLMFDDIDQYSTTTQNSGSFQTPVEIYLSRNFGLSAPIVKKYRNNLKISGAGKLTALTGFSGGDYLLELIACSHVSVDDIVFDGNSYAAKSAIRLSGDGYTGTKRNSTNIKMNRCFFYNFGATGTDGYVVDTLSPNGLSGDYSIDDSQFNGCNWLGSYGGGIRLASSEIKIDGGKFSFIGADNVNPVISLGNGSSVNITDVVFTGSNTKIIKADDGASIGRVSINTSYLESSEYPIYQQSGGTCRELYINGGYYAGLDDSEASFVLFTDNCKGSLEMKGTTFQTNGYKYIDLGTGGSYIGDVQTSTTSFKSYYPKVRGGIFTERKMLIQTTQDGDKKRFVDAKYDQICTTKLQLFVDGTDDFTRFRFPTLTDALRYVDQSNYTECEVQIYTGTHLIDEPFVFSGELTILGNGKETCNLDITAQIIAKQSLLIRNCTIAYDNLAIQNKGATVSVKGCDLITDSDDDYLIDHRAGTSIFDTVFFGTAGSGVFIDGGVVKSTGDVLFFAGGLINTTAKAANASTALCRVKHAAGALPTSGWWPKGAISESSEPDAGGRVQSICTTAGSTPIWKTTITAAV